MILGVDIGNTTVEFGIIEEGRVTSYKFSSDRYKTVDDWLVNIDFISRKGINPESILISSVVPQIEEKIELSLLKFFGIKPVVIGRDLQVPIKINYENPQEVGIDRLLNAYAGVKLSKLPLVVIDLGTAITFDIVNENGEYEGGMIFPGMESSIDTLFSKTAKLPKIKLEKPVSFIGKNTINSIQSGIYYGYTSLIDKMIEKINIYYGRDLNVIITGGHGRLISSGLDSQHKLIESLSMLGIWFLAKYL